MSQVTLTLTELAHQVSLPETTLTEIVELGIIEPYRVDHDWRFDEKVILVLSRASRLHRDLGIDWEGVALALELLDEIDTLREENRRLRRRLTRFV